MNYYEHHLGDYAEATAHLSFVEDAAYSRLLRKIYSTERPLPPEKKSVHRLIGARTKDEKKAIDDMLEEFFELREDGWHNDRADREIARFHDKQAKAKASADARWAKSGRNANASPEPPPDEPTDAMRTHSEGNAPRAHSIPQSPDTSHQPSSKAAGGGSAPLFGVDPPAPPPPFDGNNAEALNGKAVVELSKTFDLPEEWGVDAEALGWQRREVLLEAERFRQHWTAGGGKGTRRSVKGWRQSWSNWLRIAAEKRR